MDSVESQIRCKLCELYTDDDRAGVLKASELLRRDDGDRAACHEGVSSKTRTQEGIHRM